MKVVLLKQAQSDMKWWRKYYRRSFPAGKLNASQHLQKVIELLVDNPDAGQKIEGTSLRSIPVRKTPFLLIYRHLPDLVEIARIWDGRQQPSRTFQET